ncbi:hypothetical protein DFP72DRAFT_1072490 [Ephemerocybe angulata]|uniref:Uncharacterized protein n=1 Tax=Ephemerocybe angulata TaxID=980116 RepID=A0A8H6HQV8_9AGAR|nr:hypothetical protein DFP72DRAFT_1072490 [Tulosesus angulatus]
MGSQSMPLAPPLPSPASANIGNPPRRRAPTLPKIHRQNTGKPLIQIPPPPSPSHSNMTSPASSASPQTPLNLETDSARIDGVDTSPPFTFVSDAPSVHPLKGQMFAFALPSKY